MTELTKLSAVYPCLSGLHYYCLSGEAMYQTWRKFTETLRNKEKYENIGQKDSEFRNTFFFRFLLSLPAIHHAETMTMHD